MHMRPTIGQETPRTSTRPPWGGQAARQAVRIADAHHGQAGGTLRGKGPAVTGGFTGGKLAYQRHPRAEAQHRLQRQRLAVGAVSALHAVQRDSGADAIKRIFGVIPKP